MMRRRRITPLSAEDYTVLRRLVRDEIIWGRTGITAPPRPTPNDETLTRMEEVLTALLRHEMSCHT